MVSSKVSENRRDEGRPNAFAGHPVTIRPPPCPLFTDLFTSSSVRFPGAPVSLAASHEAGGPPVCPGRGRLGNGGLDLRQPREGPGTAERHFASLGQLSDTSRGGQETAAALGSKPHHAPTKRPALASACRSCGLSDRSHAVGRPRWSGMRKACRLASAAMGKERRPSTPCLVCEVLRDVAGPGLLS